MRITSTESNEAQPFKGMPLSYADPTEPIATDEWELPIIIDAPSLPAGFHKDPADQLIVATARTMGATLLTVDEKILQYEHVRTL